MKTDFQKICLIAGMSFVSITTVPAATIHYWRIEETAGTNILDGIGTAHATVSLPDSSPGAGDSGDYGWSSNTPASLLPQTATPDTASLRFPSYLPGILIDPNAPLDIGPSFTIEFFFMLYGQPNIDYPESFMDLDNSAEGVRLRFSYWKMDTGHYAFQLFSSDSGAGGSSMLWLTNFIPTAMQWHHCAFTKYDDQYNLFLDGIPVATGTLDSSSSGSYSFSTNGTHYIAGGFRSYGAWIDEFRISAPAITPSQFLISPWQHNITSISIGDDVVSVSISNIVQGTTTIVERASSLSPPPSWTTAAVIAVMGKTTNWNDTMDTNSMHFYRVKRNE